MALALGGLDDEVRAVLHDHPERPVRRRAPTCANPVEPEPEYPPLRVTEEYVTRLEGWCDEFNARLANLDSFILPGGTPGAALLHMARTVARRAERAAWALVEHDPERTSPCRPSISTGSRICSSSWQDGKSGRRRAMGSRRQALSR